MALTVGQDFAGYRIVRKLGQGGMGEVYLAQHPRLPRQDAMKVMPAAMSADDGFRRRFIREADLAASLDHPNIVNVYDRGEFEDQLWITMRFVEGDDAAASLKLHPQGLPPADVEQIITSVADALDYAHAQHLLHRDVKPANILLADVPGQPGRRRVLLADFGIARPMLDDARLTATNLTVGSFAYSSPEQISGESVDGRADQYSLACTAYQLLSGTTPFENTNAAILIHRQLSDIPEPVTNRRGGLSPQVDRVLARALEKDASRRYPSCADFASDLKAALAASVHARPDLIKPTQQAHTPNPGYPSQPAYPSGPGVGGAATYTSNPSQPGVGSNPAYPSNPSYPQPGVGSNPAYPSNPSYPQPGVGSNPAYPSNPGHPSQPGVGTNPSHPSTPSYAPTAAGFASTTPGTPGYRPAPYVAPAVDPGKPVRTQATWSLVTAILAIPASCLFGVGGMILGIVAVVLGGSALKRGGQLPAGVPNSRGLAIAGLIVGALGFLWSCMMLVGFIAS